jgi:hypothetical protein
VGLDASPAKTDDRGFGAGQVIAGRSWPLLNLVRYPVSHVRYPGPDQSTRRALLPDAYGMPCARCGRLMMPGQALDLDHRDHRSGYLGFSHRACNRAAGGRLGNDRRRARREGVLRVAKKKVALGVEISEDRAHTSIVAAGYVSKGIILVDLLAYVTGTEATPTVLPAGCATRGSPSSTRRSATAYKDRWAALRRGRDAAYRWTRRRCPLRRWPSGDCSAARPTTTCSNRCGEAVAWASQTEQRPYVSACRCPAYPRMSSIGWLPRPDDT